MGARGDSSPSLELVGDEAPTIDVFVLHCGEGAKLISDTLRAACSQDYPRNRFRVILLDDSCSDEVREAVDVLHKEFPNIHYSTRGTRPRTHARAGNMNHGLEYVNTLPGAAHEFVAFLDADNIPELCWLRRMTPHLLANPKVGAACPAARAYNIPAKDTISVKNEAVLHYEVTLLLLALTGKPVIIGTGFLARRAAIDNIGGIPTASLNDDGLMTMELDASGWQLVWVQEFLQWNLVVETLNSQIKQRTRWNLGVFDCVVYAATTKLPHWSTQNRLASCMPMFLFGPMMLLWVPLSMLVLPLVLLSHTPFITQESGKSDFLFYLGLLDLTAQIVHGDAVARFMGRKTLTLTAVDKLWILPYFMPAHFDHWLSLIHI